jgi:hypothetical protein
MTLKQQQDFLLWTEKAKGAEQTDEEFILQVKKCLEADKKEIDKIQVLSHLIASFKIDLTKSKHCSKCLGKGFQIIDVAVHKGEIHYHVIPCCSEVGKNPYELLSDKILVLNERMNLHNEALGELNKAGKQESEGIIKMLEVHNGINDKQFHHISELFSDIQKYQLVRRIHLFFRD